MNSSSSESKPWYREPWAWFVLSPLIVVVIVSSITVTIAVRNADDRVVDNYYKEGRMINMRLDEDLRAIDLNVVAQLRFDNVINEVVLELSQEGPIPTYLKLELSHPVRAELDHAVDLQPITDNFYRAELGDIPLNYRWYLRLVPIFSDETIPLWRLRGEIDFSLTSEVLLQPDG